MIFPKIVLPSSPAFGGANEDAILTVLCVWWWRLKWLVKTLRRRIWCVVSERGCFLKDFFTISF